VRSVCDDQPDDQDRWRRGGGSTGNQGYHLWIYSVSGTTATLVATYTASTSFAENDWLQWNGLNVPMTANTKYAYAFRRDSNGWERMANQSGNPYAGGDICIIPQAGGTVNYGSGGTGISDAAFAVGLAIPQVPVPTTPTSTANLANVYAGSIITLKEAASGPGPLSYQWITDGASGGSLTNVPSATSSNLVVDTTAFTPGNNYIYAVIVTNSFGAATSSVVTLTIVAASDQS